MKNRIRFFVFHCSILNKKCVQQGITSPFLFCCIWRQNNETIPLCGTRSRKNDYSTGRAGGIRKAPRRGFLSVLTSYFLCICHSGPDPESSHACKTIRKASAFYAEFSILFVFPSSWLDPDFRRDDQMLDGMQDFHLSVFSLLLHFLFPFLFLVLAGTV